MLLNNLFFRIPFEPGSSTAWATKPLVSYGTDGEEKIAWIDNMGVDQLDI